ncbi:MAG: hypothetical protein COB09_16925 [Thalassobium sp.]|nr:MAG: hypothetical protein COB09_16925 [Thalassobium sp.]
MSEKIRIETLSDVMDLPAEQIAEFLTDLQAAHTTLQIVCTLSGQKPSEHFAGHVDFMADGKKKQNIKVVITPLSVGDRSNAQMKREMQSENIALHVDFIREQNRDTKGPKEE